MSIPATSASSIAAESATIRGFVHPLRTIARITRFDRAALAGSYAMLGGYIAGAPLLTDAVLGAALMILCVVCFANVVNDHADAAIDAIAKPHRPIPAGECSAKSATLLATGLAIVATGIAFTISPELGCIAIVMLVLSGAYSWWLKGTLLLGNGVIALLVGSTVVCGALAWGQVTAPVLTASVLIALYVLGQEVLFNLEDEPGDRAGGVNTTAARLNTSRTLLLYRVLLLAFMLVALVPALRGVASVAYLIATIVCVAIPVLTQLALMAGSLDAAKIARAAQLSRIMWFTGIVPLVLLRP